MKYLITKDKKFSLDGVNTIECQADEVYEDLSKAELDMLGDCCEEYSEDESTDESTNESVE